VTQLSSESGFHIWNYISAYVFVNRCRQTGVEADFVRLFPTFSDFQ
jgi:hypothetical protein